jgi:hypothetical protein
MALARDPGRREELLASVRRAIEPFDVIGLADTSRRNWYPVLAEDLVAARHKLGATREEIEGILESSGESGNGGTCFGAGLPSALSLGNGGNMEGIGKP